jgi:hypothetical protein
MALHPDERPETVEIFRQSLIGDRPVLPRPNTRPQTLTDILRHGPEKSLWWLSIGLMFISLVFTLIR